jgi:hypothetical protein
MFNAQRQRNSAGARRSVITLIGASLSYYCPNLSVGTLVSLVFIWVVPRRSFDCRFIPIGLGKMITRRLRPGRVCDSHPNPPSYSARLAGQDILSCSCLDYVPNSREILCMQRISVRRWGCRSLPLVFPDYALIPSPSGAAIYTMR